MIDKDTLALALYVISRKGDCLSMDFNPPGNVPCNSCIVNSWCNTTLDMSDPNRPARKVAMIQAELDKGLELW